jgi:rod shape-determining protein MreC
MMKKQYIALIVFLLLAAFIFLNNSFTPLNLFGSGIESIFSTTRAALYGLIHNKEEESSELKKLREENARLAKQVIEYEKIKRDNEAFRSQFDLSQSSSYNLVPARIIGFIGSFSSPTAFIINQGENSSISTGMAVISENNLVGKISKVSFSTSQVDLVTSPSFSTLAKTADGKASGIARGNDDFVLLERVSINDNLSKNGMLISSGDLNDSSVGIPPDIIIGKIESVNKNPSLPFQTAKIQSAINFRKLETVFIFTGLR